MKFSSTFTALFAFISTTSAHLIFQTLVAGDVQSDGAVRLPWHPGPLFEVTGEHMACNENPYPANETVTVSAGSTIGFKLGENWLVTHPGPAALYLGKVPKGKTVDEWDGSGKTWFKIAEWGVESFNPIKFAAFGATELLSTIPRDTPSGEYLLRAEQIGVHLTDMKLPPQSYMSCAQIKIVNGGKGRPKPLVSIPGHIPQYHPGVYFDVWNNPTSYELPPPAVWRGGKEEEEEEA